MAHMDMVIAWRSLVTRYFISDNVTAPEFVLVEKLAVCQVMSPRSTYRIVRTLAQIA